MAESAAAAAAPSSGPGGKGSSSGTWWKSLTSRKKPKDAPAAAPGAPRPPPDPSEPPFAPPNPSDLLDTQQPSLGGGSSRRNLKISRSGRFKEKRKVRATLESPQRLFEGAGSGAGSSNSAPPALPGEETACP